MMIDMLRILRHVSSLNLKEIKEELIRQNRHN